MDCCRSNWRSKPACGGMCRQVRAYLALAQEVTVARPLECPVDCVRHKHHRPVLVNPRRQGEPCALTQLFFARNQPRLTRSPLSLYLRRRRRSLFILMTGCSCQRQGVFADRLQVKADKTLALDGLARSSKAQPTVHSSLSREDFHVLSQGSWASSSICIRDRTSLCEEII